MNLPLPKHEPKTCPRCKALFICKPGDIGNCQCQGPALSNEAKDYLMQKYCDCLCRSCLEELSSQTNFFWERFGNSPH